MYQIDIIKKTELAKKLGGLPIFHDGFIRSINMDQEAITLDIKLLSLSNPLLSNDTHVLLKLINVTQVHFRMSPKKDVLTIIHDLDIRPSQGKLHLIIESTEGEISEVEFEKIELIEA